MFSLSGYRNISLAYSLIALILKLSLGMRFFLNKSQLLGGLMFACRYATNVFFFKDLYISITFLP